MFKILVADDEEMIRRGIIAMLTRGLSSREVVFTQAENGVQALERCAEWSPDLVISDIRMPGCDGLEFIRRLRSHQHSPDVIILSGYEDFSYAKAAISLGVREYLLKPVKKQEFIALVSDYIERIEKAKQHRDSETSHYISIRRTEDTLRRGLLLDLLQFGNKNNAISQLKGLGIHLDGGLYQCALLQVRLTENNQDYISAAAGNIATEVLEEMGLHGAEWVDCGQGVIAFLYHGQQREALFENEKKHLSRTASLLKQHLRAEVCVGIGEAVSGCEAAPRSYETAELALLCKIFGVVGSLHPYETVAQGQALSTPDFADMINPTALADDLMLIVTRVNSQFDNILAQGPSKSTLLVLRNTYNQLMRTVQRQLIAVGREDLHRDPPALQLLWDSMQLHREIASYIQWLGAQVPRRGDPCNPLFAEIMRYVRLNAAKDINLNTVALQFNRSPGYLSSLFKKTSGQTFTDLLTAERMKLAREMLENTAIPVTEISTMCGYASAKHFSSVFRKHFAINPAAYRERHRIEKLLT